MNFELWHAMTRTMGLACNFLNLLPAEPLSFDYMIHTDSKTFGTALSFMLNVFSKGSLNEHIAFITCILIIILFIEGRIISAQALFSLSALFGATQIHEYGLFEQNAGE